jgi:hypothetical protein
MSEILERKFAKVWQLLKANAAIKSSAWFKKTDTAVSSKVETYQKARENAESGLVEDLLKLGKALRALDDVLVKCFDAKGLSQISDAGEKKGQKTSLVTEINRYKTEVQHERSLFDSRLKAALAAADNDIAKLESLEAAKKKELWKGFGVNL